MTDNQEKHKTPKWLRRLEKESWQAELLISGLALYGTLYLPEFVYWLSDTLINFFPVDYYLAGYAISFFYLFGISILTTFFIMHFILRAYWVGLIGLNSVYPDGYKIEDGFYSEIYARKVAEYLPTIKESIKAVDKQCSGMFSGAFVFILMYGMMALSFSVLLAIYMLTNDFIPKIVWIILAAIFIIFSIGMMIFGFMGKSEKFRDNEKLQTNFFKLGVIYGNFMTPFLYKPLNQIMFTFQSHAKNATSSFKVAWPFMIISIALSMFYLSRSNIGIMIEKGSGEHINIHDNTVYSNNYLDQYEIDQNIFVPVIDSDIITGPFIKLFIPILRNESSIRENFCGEYEEDENIVGDANRIRKRKHYLDCVHQYINVYINGVAYSADFHLHDHIQAGRRGVQSYIPSSIIKPGKNQLKVEKMKNTENEIYDSYIVNFWYAPQNN